MNRIRVVHLITKLELGGAQINTLQTVRQMDPSRFDPWLLTGPGGILTGETADPERRIIIQSLKRSLSPIRDFRCLWQLVGRLRKLRPAVVHTHSSKAGILGRLAARLARVPVVIHTVHGFPFSPAHPFPLRWLYILLEWGVSRLTTHCIFVSRSDCQTAREYRFKPSEQSIIRSGFPFAPFLHPSSGVSEINRVYRIDPRDTVIGTIAPFKPQKGLPQLVRIAHELLRLHPSGLVFFIAGDGDLRKKIIGELKKRGIRNHFRLPGFIRRIAPVMQRFDMGLSTALWEGLPQSVIQLRLMKKPVIASNIPGHREVIRNGENGFLVQSGDIDGFSEKLHRLIQDRPLRRRLGQYGPEDFSDWEDRRMIRRQEELYQRLAGNEENT